MIIFKGIALLLFFGACYMALQAFERKHELIGEQRIQVKWDKYKSDEENLLNAAIAKNIVLRAQADKEQSDLKSEYDKKLKDLNIDNHQLKKDLQDALPRIASLLADAKLHQNRSAPSISGLPKDAFATELSTEGGRDCNGTLAIVHPSIIKRVVI